MSIEVRNLNKRFGKTVAVGNRVAGGGLDGKATLRSQRGKAGAGLWR